MRATRFLPSTIDARRSLAAILDSGNSGNRWEDENKLANLSIGTFASAADAHVAFDASNDLALATASSTAS